jgi:hypothetical protein
MKTHLLSTPSYEFCFPELDTLVLVEERDDGILIRATRDTFSPQRKERFIRELAAEGFIPEDCQWTSSYGMPPGKGLRWAIDPSWLELNPAMLARTRRIMVTAIASATLLLAVMMTVLFVRAG